MSRQWEYGQFLCLFVSGYIFQSLQNQPLLLQLFFFNVKSCFHFSKQSKCQTFVMDKYKVKICFTVIDCELSHNQQKQSEVNIFFNRIIISIQERKLRVDLSWQCQNARVSYILCITLHLPISDFPWVKSSNQYSQISISATQEF